MRNKHTCHDFSPSSDRSMDDHEKEESGSDSSEEEEEEGEAVSEESEDGGKEEGQTEERKRRKRKRRRSGMRRKLRSKYESVDEFNPEARSAQTEELERIRRLELQQSLRFEERESEVKDEEEPVEGALNRVNDAGEFLVVDLTAGHAKEDSNKVEAIVIDSDSDSEEQSDGSKKAKTTTSGTADAVKKGARVLNRKYDVIGPHPDGKVMVNVGHPPEEEDIFMAPQIAAIAKPHQVSFHHGDRG